MLGLTESTEARMSVSAKRPQIECITGARWAQRAAVLETGKRPASRLNICKLYSRLDERGSAVCKPEQEQASWMHKQEDHSSTTLRQPLLCHARGQECPEPLKDNRHC